MANTNILIKRSSSTRQPSSLAAGELAYSYQSNTLFLGNAAGNGVINVGGVYYTQSIDNATSAATPDTLVRRDASGNATFTNITVTGFISGTIDGVANAAVRLQTPRSFSVSGGDITASGVNFDGTGAVTLNASLNAIPGLSAGSYGSSTEIPVLTVAANGRVTGISTQSISTSFTLTGDTGTTTISGGDTLTVVGGAGITSAVSGDQVTFDVDNTVVRSNTAITSQTIDGNITIAGNLIVQGTQTVTNTNTLNIADPLIYLAANNYSGDAVDIGFAANYFDGSTQRHTGFFRDAGTKEYYVFDNYTPELSGNNQIDVANSSFNKANVHAGYVKGNLIASTAVSDGFYGNAGAVLNLYPNESYAASGDQYIIVDPTAVNHVHVRAGGTIDGSTAELFLGGENTTVQVSDTTKEVYIRANNINAATFANNGTLSVFGKVTAAGINLNDYTQAAFDKANNSVQASSNFTFGQMVVADGDDSLKSLANASYTLTGSLSVSKAITSLTVDAYGRVTAATAEDIAIAASAITSGTLGVERGGTGQSSFTTGAILVGNGTGGLQTLANSNFTATGSGSANNTVSSLTVDAYGRVTAATFSAISGLTVAQGGTGRSSFTTNGIVYGNSTDGQLVTAVAGGSDQTWSNQILTVTNAGVPVWSSALDGGTF
jgi:hypothetical protein